jgi:hypothetical protein
MRHTADDYVEIQTLLGIYCFAADWGDLDQMVSIFHPDIRLRPHFEGDEEFVGIDAVRDWFVGYFARIRSPRRFVRHKVFLPAIVLDEEGARSSMYFDSESVRKDQAVVSTAIGRYDSRFARHDGRWLISEHTIISYYTRRNADFTVTRDTPPPAVLKTYRKDI